MRKLLLVITVLFVAAQAFASTVTMSVTQPSPAERKAYIGYSADANVSGFGLKIYTKDPNTAKFTEIADYNVGECNAVKKGYGIFPGGIDINEDTGVVDDWNTPIAPPWDPCAAGTGLGTNTIIVELGALYVDGNEPATNGTLLSVKVDGDCTVCVEGEPLRGNVVVYETNWAVVSLTPAPVCTSIVLQMYYDFGDAPDTYPTLKASGGPYHKMAGPTTGIGPILGNLIDAEADGQPSANANGDGADEDGVTFPLFAGHRPLIIHEKGHVTVKVTNGPGYLNGWIDWRNDGTFTPEATDHVVVNLPVITGDNVVDFNVPGESNFPAENTTLYSRWRISTEPNYSSAGYAGYEPNGEVEDYHDTNDANQRLWWHVPDVVGQANTVARDALIENGLKVTTVDEYNNIVAQDYVIRTQPPFCTYPSVNDVNMVVSKGPQPQQPRDFGDANNSYKTTLAVDGARHVATGVTLGANRDSEADGVPTGGCNGDDLAGVPDDEDGVKFAGGRAVTVTVSATCKLNAWVDFSNDGNFDDPCEQIYTNRALLNVGANPLVFTVPATAVKDANLISRWRVTDYNLSVGYYYGEANNGEVEDYNRPFISSCYDTNNDGNATNWNTVGKPMCWCYSRQCHGDADGVREGLSTTTGYWWVGQGDLDIMGASWMVKEPPKGSGVIGRVITVGTRDIPLVCADFDRKREGLSTTTGYWWVGQGSLDRMGTYWMKKEVPKGSGTPANCLPGNKTRLQQPY